MGRAHRRPVGRLEARCSSTKTETSSRSTLRPWCWSSRTRLTPRSIVTRMVRSLGFAARGYQSGDATLGFFHEHPGTARLVLADLGMPRMDGGELAERVQDLRASAASGVDGRSRRPPRGGSPGRAIPTCRSSRSRSRSPRSLQLLAALVGAPASAPAVDRRSARRRHPVSTVFHEAARQRASTPGRR